MGAFGIGNSCLQVGTLLIMKVDYYDRTTYLLKGTDKLFEILEDHIVKVQAMKGSVFAKPFEARISTSEERLVYVQQLVNEWLNLQSSWLYLEPIFSSDDILSQLPTEGRRYVRIFTLRMTLLVISDLTQLIQCGGI